MKKLLCLLMVCAMLLSLNVFATADADLETQLAGIELEAPSLDLDGSEKELLDRASLALSTDDVTLSDTRVDVYTEDGLHIAYTYPTDSVVCLSQDLEQQTYLYLCFYSGNMTAVANDFVDSGMHLNIYDIDTETDIYLYTDVCVLSSLIENLSVLSDDDVLVIQQLLADNYFPDADSLSVGVVGKNLWFFADYGSAGVLLTYVNGVEVACTFSYVDTTGPVPALTLLENLSVSVA